MNGASLYVSFRSRNPPFLPLTRSHSDTFSPDSIALTDRLPPPVDRRRHLVSCIVYTPYRVAYAPLAPLPPGKARLLAAMRQVKEQYDAWLAEPCLAHLIAALAPQIAPTKAAEQPAPGVRTFAPTMTNVGRVENYVAPVWPRDGTEKGGEAVIRVSEMHIACRMGSVWFTPCVFGFILRVGRCADWFICVFAGVLRTIHAWSMQGRLSVLLQVRILRHRC